MFPPESIVPIYSRFESLYPNIDNENISSEWRSISTHDYLLKQKEKTVEEFWSIVFQLKDSLGNYLFPNLSTFIQGFLALPHSSAAAERQFSNLNFPFCPSDAIWHLVDIGIVNTVSTNPV